MDPNVQYPPELPLRDFDFNGLLNGNEPEPEPEPKKTVFKKRTLLTFGLLGSVVAGLSAGGYWAYQNWHTFGFGKPRKTVSAISEFLDKQLDRSQMAAPYKHAARVFTGQDGMIYVQQQMPIYVKIATSADPNAANYQLTGNENDPMYLDGPGEHHLSHSHNGGILNQFLIRSDEDAPKMWSEFRGAERYTQDSTVFYGKGLQVEVKSQDDISGIQQTYVSIDGVDFLANDKVWAFDREKAYSLRYYGVDNVGNAGTPQEKLFIVDLTTPKSSFELQKPYVSETISPQTTVLLHAKDRLSGVKKIYYRFDNEKTYREYSGKGVSLSELGEGGHKMFFYAIDQVGNREPDNTFSFYFDRTFPISESSILGDSHFINGRQYVSPRTDIKLAANDNKIGVHRIEYQINEGGYQRYVSPFKIPQNNGEYRIDYRSTDNVENTSIPKRTIVWMDLEKPISEYTFEGPTFFLRDTLYITTRTELVLPAKDQFSSIKQVNFRKDADPQKTFSKPITIQGRGFHEVIFHALDMVNNRESDKRVAFVVDDRPPQIFNHMSANKYEDTRDGNEVLGVYPQLTQIFLAATDDISGTKTIWYSINGGAEQVFKDPIRNLKQGVYTIDIRAQDNVTNESRSRVRFAIGRF